MIFIDFSFKMFLLLSHVSCICDLQRTIEMGAYHHSFHLGEAQTLCLNSSSFPLYLLFHSIPDDVKYHEYTHVSSEAIDLREYTVEGKNLDYMRLIERPFASFALESKTDGVINITTVVMPGICKRGVYGSSSPVQSLSFIKDGDNFFTLNSNFDRCVVFSIPEEQNVEISMKSKDIDNVAYIYDQDITNFQINRGNFEKTKKIGSETNATVFRLTTNQNDDLPDLFQIKYKSQYNVPKPRSSFIIPHYRDVPCKMRQYWYSEDFLIFLIIITCVFFVVTIMLLIIRNCCKHTESTNEVM